MKKIIVGLLAHVDAGKTTLSESMLFHSGVLRKLGRVDHQTSFLDFERQERERGITLYLKQAQFQWEGTEFTLLDTPGHLDFSSEMERTLHVLDVAVIVISAVDKIQSHTRTIWRLLQHYKLPAFFFVNKMDITHESKEELILQLKQQFGELCVDAQDSDDISEQCALSDDSILERVIQGQELTDEDFALAVANRQLFPCFFGSALKDIQITEFLNGLNRFFPSRNYPKEWGARVFKITRDNQGNRLTHLKVTGGTLKVKTEVAENEKVDQLRIYSAMKFTTVEEVSAGSICTVKGFNNISAQEGLGFEQKKVLPQLVSCLQYRLNCPSGSNNFKIYRQLKQLEEEDPLLHFQWRKQDESITAQMMGAIQIEVLQQTIAQRFNLDVSFVEGQISYLETITQAVVGVGHFEPLRHYAEVHLLLQPLPRGSGLIVDTQCPLDLLEVSWQKMVLSVLDDVECPGVLTGSPITDMKITLVAGKAHNKHTEGQDFREATLRALRQGLRSTSCVVLEPMFQFEMEVPQAATSRALFDLNRMRATTSIQQGLSNVKISGVAPVSRMRNYQSTLVSYTKGLGQLTCSLNGYQPVANQEELIAQIGYLCDGDLAFPTSSIFCSQGAGFLVCYNQVSQYQHLPSQLQADQPVESTVRVASLKVSEEELREVIARTYKQKPRVKERTDVKPSNEVSQEKVTIRQQETKEEILFVDGYNIIHDWQQLTNLAQHSLSEARDQLIQLLENYQATQKGKLILVFDAYLVLNNSGSLQQLPNFQVVYTKTGQTADMYIERQVHLLANKATIHVATSDGLEQLTILKEGALRLPARVLQEKVMAVKKEVQNYSKEKTVNYPLQEIKLAWQKK